MWFVYKIIFTVVLIVIIYVLWVFLFPTQVDKIATDIWILEFNLKIRGLKSWADNVSENLLQIKSWEEIIDKAKNVANDISWSINTTKNVIQEKVEQWNKVINSAKKTWESLNELRENISDFTTLSWSTSTTTEIIDSWSIKE